MTTTLRCLLLSLGALALVACPAPSTCDGGSCGAEDASTHTSNAACDAGTFTTANGACLAAGAICDAGFEADPSGWGCVAVVASCDAGSIAVPGGGCAAVGWSTCPDGFTHDGWSCQPTLPEIACNGATRAALGATSCTPIGDCGAPFPPTNATLFVDAALDGGDATHFSSITAALAAAAPGATIAVAPGSYAESLTPTKPVHLIGRCAAQVELTGNPAVFANGVSGIELEGFTVRDSLLALRAESGAGLTLRHAVLEHNQRSAVQALDPGTRVTLEDVVVRDTQPDSSTQTFGQGIAASYGAQISLTDVELNGNRETGLFLDRADTSATVTRTVVSKTLPRASTGRTGWGVGVQRGATLTADRLVIEDSTTTGLVVTVAPSAVTLTDSLVRRTSLGVDNLGQPSAVAVAVLQGATLSWNGGAADGSPGSLVHAQDMGSTATLENVTARGVTATTGVPASGIDAQGSAHVSLTRVAVRETVGSAVFAGSQGELTLSEVGIFDVVEGVRAQQARVTGSHVEVRGHSDTAAVVVQQGTLSLDHCVLADGSDDPAVGAAASDQSLLTLDQCLVTQAQTAAVYAQATATALVTSSVLQRTRLSTAGEFGQGIIVESGATAQLLDVTVADNHSAGLQVADAQSSLSAERVTVRGTQPNGAGTRGRGANANFGGAQLTVTNSAFVDNGQVGLFSFQSRIEATDSVVLNTHADADGSYGNGIEALTDGVIVFTRGALEGNPGIAAVFAEGAGVLDSTRVARNAVGLHAQDGSAVEELASTPATLGTRQVVVTTSTQFVDNQSKLSAVTVPLPPP